METSDGADDQGSGWLLVKKRQRSSSKFSVNNWVGGFSTKQISHNQRHQPSVGAKLDAGNYVDQHSKAKRDAVLFDPGVRLVDSDCKAGVTQNRPQGKDDYYSHPNSPDALPNIKWGDLDEKTLLLHDLHQGKTLGPVTKVCNTGSPNAGDMKSEDSDGAILHHSSGHNEDKFVAKCVDGSHSPIHSQVPSKESLENQVKGVGRASLGDAKLQNIHEENIEATSLESSHNRHLENKESTALGTSPHSQGSLPCAISSIHPEPAVGYENGCSVPQILDFSSQNTASHSLDERALGADIAESVSGNKVTCTATEEDFMIQALPAPCKMGHFEVSDISVVNDDSNITLPSNDSESAQPDNTGVVKTPVSAVVSITKDIKSQSGDVSLQNLTKTGSIDCIDANGDESKERFRERLWCFLFENLNRAVDELYLLCELECDVEQTKEAILVLEEAASDFKELNSRVEEFEKVKKSSQNPEGSPPTLKADHRRPHALSWEVRRMTTSPRRAEILSSSLEAFRKIQEQRASTRACDAISSGPSRHMIGNSKESVSKLREEQGASENTLRRISKGKKVVDSSRSTSSALGLPHKEQSSAVGAGKNKRDMLGATSETEKQSVKRDKMPTECITLKNSKSVDFKRHIPFSDREKEKPSGTLWKSMDAWKEKRNWEDILAPPHRVSSRYSHSPSLSRKSAERARTLHDKLMSPEKKKKSVLDLKKEAEEKHARAMRIRNELENERVQRLQRTSEKLNRVNEFQAVRNSKLREDMYARHQKSESRHEAFLAQVVRRANDESSKVNEVRFITSLNEENKKLSLRQKLHDSGLRRAEKLQLLRTKQKEDIAREEAVLERKKLLEAEKLQRIAEMQKKKEEAQVRREEERKASSAAREAKAMEQMRRKEIRAKAQQEEAELLAQKLAERLSESEQRRKFYLEQIRERASMDFRDQTSPFLRRLVNKEGQDRSGSEASILFTNNMNLQQSSKRRIKRIRQKLMALKHEYPEPSVGAEVSSIGYRTAVGTARAKIGRWLQELQKLRQARKEGAASFGLITTEMIKFLEGKDAELQATRQAGLLDFIASALPASHTSKPEACQVTLCLLKLLNVVLTAPGNRSYFVSQNLLPPVIPMLAAALETYIKMAASSNVPGSTGLVSGKLSGEMSDPISDILEGFLLAVATIMGHVSSNEQQIQMLDGLLELVISYQVIHRLRDLFALYDRPQVEGSPFPSSIILSIKFLAVLTYRFRNVSSIDWDSFEKYVTSINGSEMVEVIEAQDFNGLPDVPEHRDLDESVNTQSQSELSIRKTCNETDCFSPKIATASARNEPTGSPSNNVSSSVSLKENDKSADKVAGQEDDVRLGLKPPVEYLLLVISETGLVCLPSMLTAVLLQANNKSSSEPVSYVLPSNFEEVATGVLKVLNNLAQIDLSFIQRMLARPDLKMEFFHISSFLLSHCTSKWGVATDQIGVLLLETSSLLGYFALFHPENQAVLRWGKSPTILHKVCDLPFVFFSDPALMPILAGTLTAACFRCEQNKSVILQELSLDMVLSLLKSYRDSLPAAQPTSVMDNPTADETGESNQPGSECRKLQTDVPQRLYRYIRSGRTVSQKGVLASNNRTVKIKNQRENKVPRISEEMGQKNNQIASEASALTLHARFPKSFIDRAEQFFQQS